MDDYGIEVAHRQRLPEHRTATALAELLGAVSTLAELATDPHGRAIVTAEIGDIDLARAKLVRLLARLDEKSRFL